MFEGYRPGPGDIDSLSRSCYGCPAKEKCPAEIQAQLINIRRNQGALVGDRWSGHAMSECDRTFEGAQSSQQSVPKESELARRLREARQRQGLK